MSRQYLDVPYRSKDAAKALGARFDGTVKRWYVEAGVDLVAFSAWLPAGTAPSGSASRGIALADEAAAGVVAVKKGISLSRLLNGVAAAVAQAFASGVWTLVEVNEASVRNGHVYLELSERDGAGQPIARTRAMIWAGTASRILPDFEKATGAVIGAGIKLLVRAKPVFKAQYGLSLEIDAIDSEYTLGDLEARKKEIRVRLQQEGVFDRNRRLSPPWDYRVVLVVAPQDAAGLGDFRKEAERLEQFGVCRFIYAHSRFQGEGAAREVVAAASAALRELGEADRPDAIVIIRGGGAVNDLAWLNDYQLARFICDQDIPVLTGIGHERDSTLPDEVAHARFDTPSKVIGGIEQQISRRVREARTAWDAILAAGTQSARTIRLTVERSEAAVRADAREHLARAKQESTATLNMIAVGAVRRVHDASRQSLALLNEVRADAMQAVATAKQAVPVLMTSVRIDALSNIGEARSATGLALNTIVDRTAAATRAAAQALDNRLQRVAERAAGAVQQARGNAQALMREVAGQGPEKTLTRGFAIVRTEEGRPVSSSEQAQIAPTLHIQFRDGSTEVRTVPAKGRK
ncbi:exodeoxyribonuclease VII large subunit [Variovorax boronicumulans]|uniref:exodeoxyribonuclease VII large subunit n=1 Tax=Variovorax boronicumulans TaxID=436515 RepID=UPI0027803235|nr:exodeoxyribonuclease VII large subunit [Variovorax boronicumulans]MDP9995766.1 exodeoxyribonuclease VII large subunit [Variovorax boronicumulans]MDQ0006769.1 exodeoxyribonuclease VII large subunit [Variovorax boronicumulans]